MRHLQGRTGLLLAFVLGVVVASAGTATAAKLLTGKEIKDGSIARKDLKAGVRAELSERAEPGPAGAPGAAGAPGPRGPQGLQGMKGDTGAVPQPEASKTIADFTNGWQSFGANYTVKYWKDPFGVVHLQGSIKGGTVSTDLGSVSVPAFTLPAGNRPETIAYFPVVSTTATNVPVAGGYVEICGSTAFCEDFEGAVSVFGANNAYVSLDGITFRSE